MCREVIGLETATCKHQAQHYPECWTRVSLLQRAHFVESYNVRISNLSFVISNMIVGFSLVKLIIFVLKLSSSRWLFWPLTVSLVLTICPCWLHWCWFTHLFEYRLLSSNLHVCYHVSIQNVVKQWLLIGDVSSNRQANRYPEYNHNAVKSSHLDNTHVWGQYRWFQWRIITVIHLVIEGTTRQINIHQNR